MNGNVRGIGNRNKLTLSIFIQNTMNDFAEKEFSTPNDWVSTADAIILHCNGNHKDCSLLARKMVKKYITSREHLWLPIFDRY